MTVAPIETKPATPIHRSRSRGRSAAISRPGMRHGGVGSMLRRSSVFQRCDSVAIHLKSPGGRTYMWRGLTRFARPAPWTRIGVDTGVGVERTAIVRTWRARLYNNDT
ncbi:hypothetical protein THAOC_32828 [Thalassiosira oceanica]|uniref:Uncharacterized protein n=1 Tax=Thalassiosira oceanica TaxID=159749 RepID=K0R6D1_THAOC|nr:hypothetical protein THAOC_32828 [Thalassiosira oceanica]|eukprot:EJK48380.1 hypothetical protein THAOC_32828 [Thalassiosira oceanica]